MVAEARVASSGVVEALDEVEDGESGLGASLEACAVDQLALECGKEALAQSVVEAVPDRAHGELHTGFLAPDAEGDRGVLGSLIRMEDDPKLVRAGPPAPSVGSAP